MNDQRNTCPECGSRNWNALGCMTCGLEFFPPSEAYQNASAAPVSERIAQLGAERGKRQFGGAERWAPAARLPALSPAQKKTHGILGHSDFTGYRHPELPAPASPIEQKFWDAHLRLPLAELTGLVPQHQAGRYRIDFALPDRKIGIELDGFATHSSTTAIARDRKRQRDLEADGWRIIRFGGAEVHRDAEGCARQAAHLIKRIWREG